MLETADRCHPRLGAVLAPDVWRSVFADGDFQQVCNQQISPAKSGWLSKSTGAEPPAPADDVELGERLVASLEHLAKWPSMRAYLHCLDAEAALASLSEAGFLTELTGDIVLEELSALVGREGEQAGRGGRLQRSLWDTGPAVCVRPEQGQRPDAGTAHPGQGRTRENEPAPAAGLRASK
jgi:hypothetical protein